LLGVHFEAEIREQPDVWRRIARSDRAATLARAIRGRDVVLLGSGSSLFVAQLGALALRCRGVRAHALAATEAPQDCGAYRDAIAIACSQSGESEDLLHAVDVLRPATLIALTNSPSSALGKRASTIVDVGAGTEVAVPASKSVTASAAILLWAADAVGGFSGGSAEALAATAQRVAEWFDGPHVQAVRDAAQRIAPQRSAIVVGTGFGLPIALESALKLKEASYLHAEGFAAGEFRHGSAAILDAACAMIGIVDDASRQVVERPMRAAAQAGSRCFVIGERSHDMPALGPEADGVFDVLAWLVVAQTLALFVGRARNVDSDAPRGLSKIVLNRT
jgi:glucosamine--fructose-6-phosphate aminotransferase (isomerizing)